MPKIGGVGVVKLDLIFARFADLAVKFAKKAESQ
jgi:hypothetical protein